MTEFDVIDTYFARLTPGGQGVLLGVGDDAALLEPAPGTRLVVSADTLVSGVHYFPEVDPADLGHKALAVNLSDLAAMAATPRWFTLALTLSETELRPAWLDGFRRGLGQLAREHRVALVGGDLCQGPLAVTIQVLGECPHGQEVRRSGAQAGDHIYLSGPLGSAAHALAQLQCGQTPHPQCHASLLRPRPRLATGLSLRGIASAMIDVSDGLLADLGHLLKASGVGARVDIDTIPHHDDVARAADPAQKWRCILSGGDDYELCFTVPPAKLQALEATRQPLHRIGEVTAQPGLHCLRQDGTVFIPDRFGYAHC